MVVILRVEANTRDLPTHIMVFIDAFDVICDCTLMIAVLSLLLTVYRVVTFGDTVVRPETNGLILSSLHPNF